MFAQMHATVRKFAFENPHLFYCLPMLVIPVPFYMYRRAKTLQMAPESTIPFRRYYYVIRPEDARITEDNARAYNWDDLRAYRRKYFPHMDRLPVAPKEPGIFPVQPYPKIVTRDVPQDMEPVD